MGWLLRLHAGSFGLIAETFVAKSRAGLRPSVGSNGDSGLSKPVPPRPCPSVANVKTHMAISNNIDLADLYKVDETGWLDANGRIDPSLVVSTNWIWPESRAVSGEHGQARPPGGDEPSQESSSLTCSKWTYQPYLRSRSWRSTIDEQRQEGAEPGRRLRSGTLNTHAAEDLGRAYELAVLRASAETGLAKSSFPIRLPKGSTVDGCTDESPARSRFRLTILTSSRARPPVQGPRADAREHPRGVPAEEADVVAALLDQEGRILHRADPPADLEEAFGREAPRPGRVGLGDVEAERDDQRDRVELADDLEGLVEFFEVAAVVDVLGEREVVVEPLALRPRRSRRRSPRNRGRRSWDGRGSRRSGRRTAPRRCPGRRCRGGSRRRGSRRAAELGPEVLGGDRAVAEVAEPAVGVALGVVPGGPAEAIDQGLAGDDRRGPRERDVHRGPGGLVGVFAQGREGVDAVIARRGRSTVVGRAVGPADREDVGIDELPGGQLLAHIRGR